MMAKSTVAALGVAFVLAGGPFGSWTVAQEGQAPPAPRPFTPVASSGAATASTYSESAARIPVTTTTTTYETISTPNPEASSPSRFQLDGTEQGSRASKDVQTYNANTQRTQTVTQTQTQEQPAPNRPFRTQVPVRTEPLTGYSVGVYGGVNAAADADGSVLIPLVPASVRVDLDSNSDVGAAAGVKFRYTWPFDPEPIDQWKDEVGGEGFRISGALEGELGYVGGGFDGNAGAVNSSFDYDAFTFMVNAYLVFQAERWRPYAGVGGGGAALFLSNDAAGEDETMSLAYQGILGVDYFLRSDWSLFAEYKYLVFDGIGDVFTSSDIDQIEQHLFMVGARKHF